MRRSAVRIRSGPPGFIPLQLERSGDDRETANTLKRFGFSGVEVEQGGSIYPIETPDSYLAFVFMKIGHQEFSTGKLFDCVV